ncbi:Uncharacterised protein [uncultured archaeon]|nr:Uncharacterised protein [uncultured archaeon]
MRKMKLHPKIWTHVRKMYDHYYGSNFKDVLLSLLEIEEEDANYSIFNKLSFEDGLVVIKDLLENNEVKKDRTNNWNYFGDFISEWRPQLIEYLRDNGIEYNEETKNFILTSGEPIPLIAPKTQLSNLVDIDFQDFFYNKLRDEINTAYRMELFTSVMLLSRKLFENLLIEILRFKYPPNQPGNLEIYYVTRDQKFQNFTVLLMNIEDKKDEFTVDKHIVSEIISLIKPFRERANSNAHSIIIISKEDDILKYEIPHISALLLKLYSNIKNSL